MDVIMNSLNENTSNNFAVENDAKIKNRRRNINNIKKNEYNKINETTPDYSVENLKKKEIVKKISHKYLVMYVLLLVFIFIIIFGFLYIDINRNKNNNNSKTKCDSGFYIPEEDETSQNCQKCTVENCEKCVGNKYMNFCTECKVGFQPIYQNEMVIKFCKDNPNSYSNENCLELYENSTDCKLCKNGYFLSFYTETKKQCKICSINKCQQCFGSVLSDICLKCINGYFIPDDDLTKQKCQKCSTKNCEKCIGTNSFDICISCLAGFTSVYESGIIIKCSDCITGGNEKCLTCDYINDICSSCNIGYYLPTDEETKKQCQKCSIDHCEICEGSKSSNRCTKCLSDFTPIYESGTIIKCANCITGENEKCLTCDYINHICSSCNIGYFLPIDDEIKKHCQKCSIDHCEKCEGTKSNDICTKCLSGFPPIYEGDIIVKCANCITGENEKCFQCDTINGKCIRCNIGYYLPTDDEIRKECKKCSLDNCEICEGTKSSNICTKCLSDFTPAYESGIIIKCSDCITGENEKCLACDYINDICSSCNIGYYLPTDDETKKQCQKCSIDHCEKCEGTKISDVCVQCENLYELKFENCIKKRPLIEAIYNIEDYADEILLINLPPNAEILEQWIDGEKISEPTDYYELTVGNHSVSFYLDLNDCSSLSAMFEENKNLISISFKYFELENIEDMSLMFSDCISLTSVDLSNFNSENVKDLKGMFNGCKNLTFINLYNFDTKSVTNMGAMFFECESLTSIDLSSFNTESLTNMESMFDGCASLISIDLSSFDTESVTNMNFMFDRCESLISFDFSHLNTKNVITCGWMFHDCKSLTSVDLSNFNGQSVINMNFMFYKCKSLTSIDLSNIHTQRLNSSCGMFDECSALSYIDISNFFSPTTKDIESMFENCISLTSIDFSTFTTTYLTRALNALNRCTSLIYLDISTFHNLFADIIDEPMNSNTGIVKVYNDEWKAYINTKIPGMEVEVVN